MVFVSLIPIQFTYLISILFFVFFRTLKGKIYKYFRENLTYKWHSVLQDMVDSYNDTVHSFLKRPPSSITKDNEQEVYEKLYLPMELKREKEKIKFQFSLGDKVRISKQRRPFQKDYEQMWSEEVFEVYHRIPSHPPKYKVRDLMQEPVLGSFYTEDLKRVEAPDDALYRINKIIRYRTRNKQREALVEWSGYSSKFNSYIPVKDIVKYKK